MGGLFALYVLLTKPELFKAYLASSPWLLAEDEELIQQLDVLLQMGLPSSKMLYIAHEHIERNGIEGRILKVVENLKKNAKNNLSWKYKRYDDADHSNLPLKAEPDALDFFFKRD